MTDPKTTEILDKLVADKVIDEWHEAEAQEPSLWVMEEGSSFAYELIFISEDEGRKLYERGSLCYTPNLNEESGDEYTGPTFREAGDADW